MKKIVLNGCYGGFGLSKKAYEFLGLSWDEFGYEFRDDRTNSKLIECVETIGDEADGRFASLYIDEFDDYNYDYYIHEYDGIENLVLIPIVHKEKLQNMNVDEIVEYLKSIDIQVVD